jgi:hypothetical protein
MKVDASDSAVVRAIFSKLVDYAGLFPPARLSMQESVAEYMVERQGRYAWMLGRFIVQHSRIPELRASVDANDRFALTVILDRGTDSLQNIEHRMRGESPLAIQSLEIMLAPAQIDAYAQGLKKFALTELSSYVEFARDRAWEETVPQVMRSLTHCGLGAKVRCGGLEPAAFPTPQELAIFIYWACEHNVPFKATAGLHHPIRHYDAGAGVHRHGFLNLITASAIARAGAGLEEIVKALACEERAQFHVDEQGLRFGEYHVGIAQLESMRREAFVGYGSCSFSEPVADLRHLNLLS